MRGRRAIRRLRLEHYTPSNATALSASDRCGGAQPSLQARATDAQQASTGVVGPPLAPASVGKEQRHRRCCLPRDSTLALSCDALATALLSSPGCERLANRTSHDRGGRWHQRVPPRRRPQCVLGSRRGTSVTGRPGSYADVSRWSPPPPPRPGIIRHNAGLGISRRDPRLRGVIMGTLGLCPRGLRTALFPRPSSCSGPIIGSPRRSTAVCRSDHVLALRGIQGRRVWRAPCQPASSAIGKDETSASITSSMPSTISMPLRLVFATSSAWNRS